MRVIFETIYEDGYWSAHAVGFGIVTQAKTFEELLHNIEEATILYFEDEIDPKEQITIQTNTVLQVDPVAKASGC
jgi:predicted RNase H-like HicB family nuclease